MPLHGYDTHVPRMDTNGPAHIAFTLRKIYAASRFATHNSHLTLYPGFCMFDFHLGRQRRLGWHDYE